MTLPTHGRDAVEIPDPDIDGRRAVGSLLGWRLSVPRAAESIGNLACYASRGSLGGRYGTLRFDSPATRRAGGGDSRVDGGATEQSPVRSCSRRGPPA